MNTSKITPGRNLMWEASRMMLPEHKEALLQHAREKKKKPRPLFDEQHTEQFERMINDYIASDVKLFIVVYGEYEDRDLYGKITKFDPQLKRIKMEWPTKEDDEEFEWISIYDIQDIFM
jgi:hypothetical protein